MVHIKEKICKESCKLGTVSNRNVSEKRIFLLLGDSLFSKRIKD